MRGNICQRWRNALGWRDIACKDFTRFYRHHDTAAITELSVCQCPRDHFQHIARKSFVAAYAFQCGFGVSLTGGVEFFPAVKAAGQAGGDLLFFVL